MLSNNNSNFNGDGKVDGTVDSYASGATDGQSVAGTSSDDTISALI